MPNETKFTQRNQAAGKGLAQQLPGAIKRQKAKSNTAASAAEEALKTVKNTSYGTTVVPGRENN